MSAKKIMRAAINVLSVFSCEEKEVRENES